MKILIWTTLFKLILLAMVFDRYGSSILCEKYYADPRCGVRILF